MPVSMAATEIPSTTRCEEPPRARGQKLEPTRSRVCGGNLQEMDLAGGWRLPGDLLTQAVRPSASASHPLEGSAS